MGDELAQVTVGGSSKVTVWPLISIKGSCRGNLAFLTAIRGLIVFSKESTVTMDRMAVSWWCSVVNMLQIKQCLH